MEVMNAVSKSGVEVLIGWELIDWSLKKSTEGSIIDAIVLRSKGVFKTMDCNALVNFSEKTINMKIFLCN